MEIVDTAPHLEKVERVVAELLRRNPRGKRAVVTGIRFHSADARGDDRARVGIVENQLDQRRKSQTQALVVGLGNSRRRTL